MAEAGHVIASPTVPAGQRDRLPPDVADLLGFVGGYASEHPDQRLIWFTDVTRWLEWEKDSSWSALGVDWEHPLAQLTRPLWPRSSDAGVTTAHVRPRRQPLHVELLVKVLQRPGDDLGERVGAELLR